MQVQKMGSKSPRTYEDTYCRSLEVSETLLKTTCVSPPPRTPLLKDLQELLHQGLPLRLLALFRVQLFSLLPAITIVIVILQAIELLLSCLCSFYSFRLYERHVCT